jgi:NADH-quinone oxidoreductase subunit A
MDNYLPVLILLAFVSVLAVGLIVVSRLLGRRGVTSDMQNEAYECGMPLLSSSRSRFSVKFYVIAMLFILFDIEVVFMYPWATILDRPGLVNPTVALVEMLVFVLVLFVGWLYVVRKGVLRWDR